MPRPAAALSLALLVSTPLALGAQARPGIIGGGEFQVAEATIEEIHEAMRSGRLTARALVEAYFERMDAFDVRGPTLNAITSRHPGALERADELDRAFRETGRFVGPLHGIPVIVKENYDTFDLPTTAGSASLAGSIPPDDAFMVARVREAGGIVIAKSNMAEFAFSPVETVGSAHSGYTFNPYALNRVPAGSSGGTGAAVAASLGAVGLGTDTGNSIRGPSSHNALVGLRPTIGLTSRDGIIPLYLERDVGGPMVRTVRDAAIMLDVLAGTDAADPATEEADDRIPPGGYPAGLRADALQGARLGVVRTLAERRGADTAVVRRFGEVLDELRGAGATVVDPADMSALDGVRASLCSNFRTDLEAYLATLGPDAPVRTLQDIVDSGDFHVTVASRLERSLGDPDPDPDRCREADESRAQFQAALRSVLEANDLDALIYPTWSNPPRIIGDLRSPAGDNSQSLSPPSGFPAVTVPAGYVYGSLPVGLQLLGDAWSEMDLLSLAYGYEQATGHRRPPASTPPLGGG